MEELLLIIDDYQLLIYLVLGIAGLLYFSQAAKWYGEYRSAVFGLERNHSLGRLTRYGAMLVIILVLILSVFLVVNFVTPTLPVTARATAIPTISLLPGEGIDGPAAEGTTGPVSPPQTPPVGSADGCLNPTSTITSPSPGEELRGTVEVQGTANIDNFAFYKLEYRPIEPDAVWRAVSAATEPVVEDQLGTWDTSLVRAGPYQFRLVVTDTQGNAPQPCTIEVTVLPTIEGQ